MYSFVSLIDYFFLDPETQLKIRESYLNGIEKTIRHVKRDGMCIFSAVQEVSRQKRIEMSLENLKVVLRNEINSGNYKRFSGTVSGARCQHQCLFGYVPEKPKH